MAPTYSLRMTPRVKLHGSYNVTELGETGKYPLDVDDFTAFTDGTAANQANRLYTASRTLTIASPTDLLDLSGSLVDIFGRTLTLDNIKALYIFNQGIQDGDGTPVATSGQRLWVGGASSNAWRGFFETQADKVEVPSGGKLYREDPFEGWIVIPGVEDILQIEYDGSGASGGTLQYKIVIAGDEP